MLVTRSTSLLRRRSRQKRHVRQKARLLYVLQIIIGYLTHCGHEARPHCFWKNNSRQSYLDELLRWEGRGEFMHEDSCLDCIARGHKAVKPEFRCLDCFLPDLVCQSCCVRRHRMHPFHAIEVCSHHFAVSCVNVTPSCRLEMGRVDVYQDVAKIYWACHSSQSRQYAMPSTCQIR